MTSAVNEFLEYFQVGKVDPVPAEIY